MKEKNAVKNVKIKLFVLNLNRKSIYKSDKFISCNFIIPFIKKVTNIIIILI